MATVDKHSVATHGDAGRCVAGLTERILVVELQAWYMATGWLAFRRSRSLAAHSGPEVI